MNNHVALAQQASIVSGNRAGIGIRKTFDRIGQALAACPPVDVRLVVSASMQSDQLSERVLALCRFQDHVADRLGELAWKRWPAR